MLKGSGIKDKSIQYDKEKYYNLSLLAIRNNRNEVVEIEGSLLDISVQKQAENLRLLSEQEKLSSLTQLVFGISHQFNTPLGVMITTEGFIKEYLSKILDDMASGELKKEELQANLNMINDAVILASENTKAMSSMLKDLRYSINTRDSLNLADINTETLFNDLFGFFKAQRMIDNDDFILDIQVETNGINTLFSDYEVLSDTLLRLYVNTYYHAYSKEDTEQLITINLTQNEEYVCIEYSDNGRGLNDADQKNIFVPFYTGNSRQKRNSGLGMYILHNQVVQILQGKVELKSSEAGFAINILLPKNRAKN